MLWFIAAGVAKIQSNPEDKSHKQDIASVSNNPLAF